MGQVQRGVSHPMFKSYWCAAIAVGLIFSTGAIGQVPLERPHEANVVRFDVPSASNKQEMERREFVRVPVPASQQSIDRTQRKLDSDDPYKFFGDSIAQWLVALLGLVGAVTSIWAVWLLKKTLQANLNGTAAATVAATAAVENVKIARNAERPFLVPLEAELRYWPELFIDSPDNVVLEVHLPIFNLGKSVGLIESYGIGYDICREGQQDTDTLDVYKDTGRMPVRPDSELEWTVPFTVFQISTVQRDAIAGYESSLFVFGYIRYLDLFGIYRKSGFIFEFVPIKTEPAKSTFVKLRHPMWYDIEEPYSETSA
tara:strand:- start:1736 stop:2677 length:942 start_codon:yes stop_codon:yes gene_type:complete